MTLQRETPRTAVCANCGKPIEEVGGGLSWAHWAHSEDRHTVCLWMPGMEPTRIVAAPADGTISGRAGWTHRPAEPGHPERYERREPAMEGGVAISLEIVNYYGQAPDPSWTGWIRANAGHEGQICLSHDLGRGEAAAMEALEAKARELGERLLALGKIEIGYRAGAS